MMRRRPGFTLIELTIVDLNIGILVGLRLPAVQSALESGRRAQCFNNLMQLGIAICSYASTHSVLPPGVVNDTGPIRILRQGYHHSWVVQILPFMGQSNVYDHLDLRKSAYDPANDTAAGIMIATLNCPSAGSGDRTIKYAGCHHDVDGGLSPRITAASST
jgi:type II secretory pathway pseudopilin PulG